MCSGLRAQGPHSRVIRDGLGKQEILQFGMAGTVKIKSLPGAHHCVPCSKIGFAGPPGPAAFHYPNGCGHDLLRGIVERVFLVKQEDGSMGVPPTPTVDFHRLTGCARDHIPSPASASPAKLEEVPSMMNTPSKRKLYERAVESLHLEPVTRKDSYLSSFIKVEPSNYTAKADPVPRLIQPRTPRYNACVARYLKPMEHTFYRLAGAWPWRRTTSTPVILKCANPIERGRILREKWDSFSDPVAISTDASRFDQHVSREALQWEHSLYLKYFAHSGESDELAKLLTWQLVNKGFARAKDGSEIHYERQGCRMSGDMNTALGNCLIMAGLMFGFSKLHGIDLEVAVDGDDCVSIIERADLERFTKYLPEHFLAAGFTLTVEEAVDVFEKIEFCQCHPVWNGRHYIMVRNPVKALSTDLAGNRKWAQPQWHAYLRNAVGVGGGHLSVGIPIMQQWYSQLRTGEACNLDELGETGFGYMARSIARNRSGVPTVPITAEARVSFYDAYGVLPDEQIAVEQLLAAPKPLGPPEMWTGTIDDWRLRCDQILTAIFL